MPEPQAIIDTHAHLASPKLAGDLAAVLDRASGAGVTRIVSVATTAEDSPRVVALAQADPRVFAAVGIHPNEAADAGPDDFAAVADLARAPRVVAIGETGLDRYWDRAPFPLQIEYFDRHLDLAAELGLPIVIHSRDCQADVIARLALRIGATKGIQHSFTGTWDDAQALMELGLHISFAGMLTFENKALDPLRDVAARLPLDRILVETDSPYLSPHPFRGKRNEPAHAALVAETVAKVRGISYEDVAQATTANAVALFRLGP